MGNYDGGKVCSDLLDRELELLLEEEFVLFWKLLELRNVLSKSLGSNNQLSVVSATMQGLCQLRTASQISETRGESVSGPAFTVESVDAPVAVAVTE